jgi:hypothetical protein
LIYLPSFPSISIIYVMERGVVVVDGSMFDAAVDRT